MAGNGTAASSFDMIVSGDDHAPWMMLPQKQQQKNHLPNWSSLLSLYDDDDNKDDDDFRPVDVSSSLSSTPRIHNDIRAQMAIIPPQHDVRQRQPPDMAPPLHLFSRQDPIWSNGQQPPNDPQMMNGRYHFIKNDDELNINDLTSMLHRQQQVNIIETDSHDSNNSDENDQDQLTIPSLRPEKNREYSVGQNLSDVDRPTSDGDTTLWSSEYNIGQNGTINDMDAWPTSDDNVVSTWWYHKGQEASMTDYPFMNAISDIVSDGMTWMNHHYKHWGTGGYHRNIIIEEPTTPFAPTEDEKRLMAIEEAEKIADQSIISFEIKPGVSKQTMIGSSIFAMITTSVIGLSPNWWTMIVVVPLISSYISITRGYVGDISRTLGNITYDLCYEFYQKWIEEVDGSIDDDNDGDMTTMKRKRDKKNDEISMKTMHQALDNGWNMIQKTWDVSMFAIGKGAQFIQGAIEDNESRIYEKYIAPRKLQQQDYMNAQHAESGVPLLVSQVNSTSSDPSAIDMLIDQSDDAGSVVTTMTHGVAVLPLNNVIDSMISETTTNNITTQEVVTITMDSSHIMTDSATVLLPQEEEVILLPDNANIVGTDNTTVVALVTENDDPRATAVLATDSSNDILDTTVLMSKEEVILAVDTSLDTDDTVVTLVPEMEEPLVATILTPMEKEELSLLVASTTLTNTSKKEEVSTISLESLKTTKPELHNDKDVGAVADDQEQLFQQDEGREISRRRLQRKNDEMKRYIQRKNEANAIKLKRAKLQQASKTTTMDHKEWNDSTTTIVKERTRVRTPIERLAIWLLVACKSWITSTISSSSRTTPTTNCEKTFANF